MKSFVATTIALFLSGCAVIPLQQDWPEIPKNLEQSCDQLVSIKKDSVDFADFLEVVVLNYNLYHKCQILNEGWMKWYKEQKEIYEKKK